MKKLAIILAAMLVVSMSMTACNSESEEDYEDEISTSASEVVENDEEDEEDAEESTEANADSETSNVYENDFYSVQLPEGWSGVENEGKVSLANMSVEGFSENAVINYNETEQDMFSRSQEEFVSYVEEAFGTTVTVNNFGQTEINGANVLQFEYTFEKDGVAFTQTYLYQEYNGKLLTFLFTNEGNARSATCDNIYLTLQLK